MAVQSLLPGQTDPAAVYNDDAGTGSGTNKLSGRLECVRGDSCHIDSNNSVAFWIAIDYVREPW